jgi:hypothetical protein
MFCDVYVLKLFCTVMFTLRNVYVMELLKYVIQHCIICRP